MDLTRKPHQSRNSLASVHSPSNRRQSISAQISRSARRFSAAVAPQLTKLEPLPMLQNYSLLNFRIVDIKQFNTAIEQYAVHGCVQFEPIEFEITTNSDQRILKILLTPDEMTLNDGVRKILTLSFHDSNNDDNGTPMSQVKHPLTGLKVFEFIELPLTNVVQIFSSIDSCERCLIYPETNIWLRMLNTCGCFFTNTQWHFKKEGIVYATVRPNGKVLKENSLRVEWTEQCNNDLRLLVVAFAMTLLVREAFSALIHILRERRIRKS
ncbi:unnamed protein product [Enterobius vermicularis]|uniref:Phospholipid scramblase n=1 Tax=Enterobius vermicularis TaxID=51028 RepID=A0A0N4V8Q0_ENTVE|nr:unnamed protein product [Enterobius vermicularis]